MLKSCEYCGKFHDSKFDCGKKPTRKKIRPTKSNTFRSSQAWKDKAIEIKERDHYLCQICIRGLYGAPRRLSYDNLSVHHAKKIETDWDKRLDNDNLITLCDMHHRMCEDGTIPYETVKRIIDEQEWMETE